MSKTLLPLGITLLFGLLNVFFEWSGLYGMYEGFRPILWMIASFCFGLSMNDKKKRSNAWIIKLVISFLMAILLGYQLGLVQISLVDEIMRAIGFNQLIFMFIFIWCGWAFFRD